VDQISTRQVQDRVRFVRMLFQVFDRVSGWKDEQCDFAAFGFALDFVHHWQGARSSADDQTATFPGNLLFNRNRRVSELVAKFLRGVLLTLTHVPAVDDDVVIVGLLQIEATLSRRISQNPATHQPRSGAAEDEHEGHLEREPAATDESDWEGSAPPALAGSATDKVKGPRE
jgi:hypothetical protein